MMEIDRYVYPGTQILINKFGCRDEKELQHIEALSTGGNLAYLQFHPLEGNFDFQHLKDIHRFIFQDLYAWAGQIRTVDIGKNNLFCRVQFINDYAKTVFADFLRSEASGRRACSGRHRPRTEIEESRTHRGGSRETRNARVSRARDAPRTEIER